MRKIIKNLIILAIVIAVFITAKVFASTGTVDASKGLVLRTEASKTSEPMATVPNNAEVEIKEKTGDWYKVTYNGKEGYLFAEYVKEKEDNTGNNEQTDSSVEQTSNSNAESNTTTSIQNKGKLKVYNIPLITSTVISEIEPDNQITVQKEITNWSYIVSGDVQGWVRTYNLTGGTIVEQLEEQEKQAEQQEETPESTKSSEEEQETEPTPTEAPKLTQESTSQDPSNKPQNEQASNVQTVTIDVDYANIRKEASTKSDIVTTLTEGTVVTVKAETEEWYKIEYKAVNDTVYEGYIFKSLVK